MTTTRAPRPTTRMHESDGGMEEHRLVLDAVCRSAPKLTDPQTTAVVIGVGGLGRRGVQVLRALTPARVIAVDSRPEALEAATRAGADQVVMADEEAGDKINELTGGLGADVVLDFVGSQPTVELAAKVVQHLGDLTIVGIAGGVLPAGFLPVPLKASIQTRCSGSRPEFAEVIDLGARRVLKADPPGQRGRGTIRTGTSLNSSTWRVTAPT